MTATDLIEAIKAADCGLPPVHDGDELRAHVADLKAAATLFGRWVELQLLDLAAHGCRIDTTRVSDVSLALRDAVAEVLGDAVEERAEELGQPPAPVARCAYDYARFAAE